MKRILAVAFAVAILSMAFSASAQVPFVQVYFDEYGSVDDTVCPPCGLETQNDVLSVFAVNFNMEMLAIEYMISLPSALSFMGDIMEDCNLSIGNSPTGITISMPCLGNAYSPLRTQRISVWWNCCDDCAGYEDQQIVVLPHPTSNPPAIGPRAVEYQTYATTDGVGMTSVICPVTVPTQSSTWGNIKSLY
jgi:hypothetical protein